MADKIPVKARYSGSDVISLGELEVGDTINASLLNGNLPALDGSQLTNLPSGDALDGSPANHTANGPQTNTYPAGYAATVMDLVYMGQDSKWLKADADQESTSIGLLGISLESKTDTQPMNVALPGSFVRSTTWGWTVGVPLYIHTTDGSITATKPTGSGDIVRTIGFSVQVEYIFFNPSSDYITLA